MDSLIDTTTVRLGERIMKELQERGKPETIPLPVRILLQLTFRTVARKRFGKIAVSWGCNTLLDVKPWVNE